MSNLKRDALTEFFRLCIMTFSIWTMLYTECIYCIQLRHMALFGQRKHIKTKAHAQHIVCIDMFIFFSCLWDNILNF